MDTMQLVGPTDAVGNGRWSSPSLVHVYQVSSHYMSCFISNPSITLSHYLITHMYNSFFIHILSTPLTLLNYIRVLKAIIIIIIIMITSVSYAQKTMVRFWRRKKGVNSYPTRRVRSKTPLARERCTDESSD